MSARRIIVTLVGTEPEEIFTATLSDHAGDEDVAALLEISASGVRQCGTDAMIALARVAAREARERDGQ